VNHKEMDAMKTNQPANGTGVVGGPPAPEAALAGRYLTVTAVTQHELAVYLELSKQARRQRALRAELLSLLDAGAWVEPGPLSVRVESTTRRVLSAKALAAVLGEEQVRQLQEEVGPTVCRHLVIIGA
jgi:hypothetical protein